MLDAMAEVADFLADGGTDRKTQRAVERSLEIIGEAARRVSPELQKRYGDVPWKDIIGMRHKIVHDYFDLRLDILWGTAKTDLPELKGRIESIMKQNI
jgi:uncharacterized protein with HEPN domain